MKISFYIEDGSNPVLNVLPKSEGNIQKLREQVQNLEIENPALTFAKEYRKYEHNEPSAFSNLSDAQIEQIAKIADFLADLWKTKEEPKGEPRINVVKLLEILLNITASNISI